MYFTQLEFYTKHNYLSQDSFILKTETYQLTYGKTFCHDYLSTAMLR